MTARRQIAAKRNFQEEREYWLIRANEDPSCRRAEVPFNVARATHPNRPTGLADGLELESTPTRNGESAPRHPQLRDALVPPLPRSGRGIRLHARYYRIAGGGYQETR